jgi:four helix bundle protein
MTVNSYRDLRVWQKAMDLVVTSYEVAKQFPQSELYGLVSQIQRAAV